MEQITDMISENPGILGLFIAAAGALIMIGAICRWNWIVGADAARSNRVRTGLFGWIIYKLFGRRAFFIFTGAAIMIGGVALFFAFSMM